MKYIIIAKSNLLGEFPIGYNNQAVCCEADAKKYEKYEEALKKCLELSNKANQAGQKVTYFVKEY